MPANTLIPTHCPSCSQPVKVKGIHLVCENGDCAEQQIMRVVHWVKGCEMEAFSEASVRALFGAGKITGIYGLYQLKYQDFSDVEGFAHKKIMNALEQIERTRSMTIRQFVDRLGIDLVGEKAMEKLGIETKEQLLAFRDKTYVIGANIVDFIKENREYVEELLGCVNILPIVKKAAGAKHVAMTGSGPDKRDRLVEQIEANGDVFDDSVKKTTDILLVEDPNSGTTKIAKAQRMGVQIMAYGDYFK